MKLLKISLISFLAIFSFVLSSAVFAEESENIVRPVFVPVSYITFSQAKVSAVGDQINLSFDLINGNDAHSGLKYGVTLKDKTTDLVLDEYVYPGEFTLESNSTISKKLEYKTPGGLNGEYLVRVYLKNKNGLIMGLSEQLDVSLVSEDKITEILTESCFVVISNRPEEPIKDLQQEFVVPEDGGLRVSCSVKNNKEEDVNISPIYEIYKDSLYGDLASKGGEDKNEILKAGEEKEIEWILPKMSEAKNYSAKIYIKSGEIYSNSLVLAYSSSESKGSISNISLDKTFYKKGELVNLSVVWFSAEEGENFVLKTKILDEKGEECLPETSNSLVSKGKITVQEEILKRCKNPVVFAEILDSEGGLIAENSWIFESIRKLDKALIIDIVVLALIVILVVAGIIIFFVKPKNKKEELKNNENTNHEIKNENQ